MTRFQVAHTEKLPVDHPLMVSKLATLPIHAHPQQDWWDAGEMEYHYKGNAKTVTSDKENMALIATGQGQLTKQYTDSVFHASLQVHTPPKAIEDGEAREEDKGIFLPDDRKETWAERKQKLQKVTKAMADLSNEAQTIQGGTGCQASLGRPRRGC